MNKQNSSRWQRRMDNFGISQRAHAVTSRSSDLESNLDSAHRILLPRQLLGGNYYWSFWLNCQDGVDFRNDYAMRLFYRFGGRKP